MNKLSKESVKKSGYFRVSSPTGSADPLSLRIIGTKQYVEFVKEYIIKHIPYSVFTGQKKESDSDNYRCYFLLPVAGVAMLGGIDNESDSADE